MPNHFWNPALPKPWEPGPGTFITDDLTVEYPSGLEVTFSDQTMTFSVPEGLPSSDNPPCVDERNYTTDGDQIYGPVFQTVIRSFDTGKGNDYGSLIIYQTELGYVWEMGGYGYVVREVIPDYLGEALFRFHEEGMRGAPNE